MPHATRDDREESRALLFHEAMDSKDPRKIAELQTLLSAIPPVERAEALAQRVGDDLKRGWQPGGPRRRIEDYLAVFKAEFPEILDGACLAELAEIELKARCQHPAPGDQPSLDDYQRRFPNHPQIVEHLKAVSYDNGRYVRYGKARTGGMGRVWPARDLHLNRTVALKEPLPRQSAFSDVLRRLTNEAFVTARLNHPAIVAVHEVHSDDARSPFYVMQWVDGESLQAGIRRLHAGSAVDAGFERRKLLTALSAVCDAAGYSHAQGVIHRDLKPSNVVLGNFGETIVLDWGLAKLTDEVRITVRGQDVAETGEPLQADRETPRAGSTDPTVLKTTFIGTPAYMAPEQADGGGNPLSDVFCLGSILYEILTGRPPRDFQGGEDPLAIIDRVKGGTIPSPAEVTPEVPRALDAVCRKAMAADPRQRYQSASELRDELQRFLADEPVLAHVESWWERFQRRVRRRVRFAAAFLLAASLIAAVATAGAAAFGWQWRRAEGEASRADVEATKANDALSKEQAATRKLTASLEENEKTVDQWLQFTRNEKLLQDPRFKPLLRKLLEQALANCRRFIEAHKDDANPAMRGRLGDMLFEVGSINNEMGSKDQALAAYRQALRVFESLARENPDSTSLLKQIGGIYLNISTLESKSGQPKKALASLRRAAEIFDRLVREHPTVTLYQSDLAGTYNNIGSLHSDTGKPTEALWAYQQAINIRNRLKLNNPTVAKYQNELADSQNNVGALYAKTGKPADAEAAYQQAERVYKRLIEEHPNVEQYRSALARTLNNLGNFYWRTGKAPPALAAYQGSLQLRKRLTLDNPAVTQYQVDLAVSLYSLGILYGNTGETKKAFAAFREALNIRSQLAVENPNVGIHQYGLASSHDVIGFFFAATGDMQQAETAYHRALKIQEPLARDNPTVTEFQRGLAGFYSNIGSLYRRTRRYQKALDANRAALNIAGRLARDNPTVPEFQRAQARANSEIGNVYHQMGEMALALAAYRRALAIQERLARDNRAITNYQDDLAASILNIAVLDRMAGKFREALFHLDRALKVLKPLRKRVPQSESVRIRLRDAYHLRAMTLDRLARYREAVVDRRKALELDDGSMRLVLTGGLCMSLAHAGDHAEAVQLAATLAATAREVTTIYNLSCVCAIASAASLRDAKLPTVQRRRLSDEYAAKALDLLKRAVAGGFLKTPAGRQLLATDPDLDPLRNRDDFQRFCREQGVHSPVVARKPRWRAVEAPRPKH